MNLKLRGEICSNVHTCTALRYKPVFTVTWQSVGIAWFDPRLGLSGLAFFRLLKYAGHFRIFM